MTRKPVAQLRLSDAGQDVLAEREGMRLTAYQDSVGVWTIGLGHTSGAGPPEVTPGMTITEDEAWDIFYADCETFRHEAAALVKVPVAQHEFDALASFIYNIGTTQFSGSTCLKKLNASDYGGAGDAILMWDKPPEVITRRQGEHFQFMNGYYYARADAYGTQVA